MKLAVAEGFDLVECDYTWRGKSHLCKVVAESMLEIEKDNQEATVRGVKHPEMLAFIAGRMADIYAVHFAATIKDTAFKAEREWRLISLSAPSGELAPIACTPEFRCRGNLIVPYIPFKLHDPLLWKEIRVKVGPCRHETEAKAYVVRLLATKLAEPLRPRHLSKRVTHSGIPYRRM